MIRIKFQKKKIVIGSAFEYEDVLTLLVAKNLPESFKSEFPVTGKIISGSNFTDTLKDLGLDLSAREKKEKETKRVQNYVCNINAKNPVMMTRAILIELMEKLHSSCYLLFNFTLYFCKECSSHMTLNPDTKMYTCTSCGLEKKKPSVEYTISTKSNPPRPTTKQKGVPKSESQKVTAKIKFCKAILPNEESIRKELITEITPDFIDEIPTKVKLIELVNNYHVSNLVFPPRELMKNSKLFRKLTIREGSLERILKVDTNSFENVIQFRI
jgi:DNA-directed RNA polymerase subunit M/transcription elongation factor TFIIS